MLPEPDLFAGVNKRSGTACCQREARSNDEAVSGVSCELGGRARICLSKSNDVNEVGLSVNSGSEHASTIRLCSPENESECRISAPVNISSEQEGMRWLGGGVSVPNSKLMCHKYNVGLGSGMVCQPKESVGRKSVDPVEMRARRWYLIVIVMLYVGLITSFCLNITLLLRTSPAQLSQLEQSQLPAGN